MKKIFSLFLGLAVVFVIGISTASAEPAVIINGEWCNVPDGNGGLTSTNDTKSITTYSNNGNAKFICKAKEVPNDTGKAVTWDAVSFGTPCAVLTNDGVVITDDWHATVSASGNATLVCNSKTE